MKRNFLYEMTAAFRTPDYGANAPQFSVLCPQLNLLHPLPNKIPGYATDLQNGFMWLRTGTSGGMLCIR